MLNVKRRRRNEQNKTHKWMDELCDTRTQMHSRQCTRRNQNFYALLRINKQRNKKLVTDIFFHISFDLLYKCTLKIKLANFKENDCKLTKQAKILPTNVKKSIHMRPNAITITTIL